MKNNIKYFMIGSLFCATAAVTTSCDLDLEPIDTHSATSFWKTQSDFEGNILALSQMFRANYPANILFYAGEQRAGTIEEGTIDGSGDLNATYTRNQYDADHAQFSTLGGYYGFIADLNELIYRIDNTNVLDENTANGLLGIAHGWRAYAYFQMYRMYGGVVLRTEPDVVLGNYDAVSLYKPRATAEETLKLIKDDIAKSLDCFGKSTYVYNNGAKDYYWNEAATKMLAGEVFLWSGKVETDDHKATAGDVTTAYNYFKSVIGDYNYKLMPNYFDIWTTPHNSEAIYSICYTDENDGVYYSNPTYYFLWARLTGAGYQAYWSNMDENGWGHVDGVANRFGRWCTMGADGEVVSEKNIDIWDISNFGPMRLHYKNSLYYQFDAKDIRREMFYPQWKITDEEREANVRHLDNFDPTQHELVGTYVCKFRPKMISSSTYYTFANDMPIYRITLAYMYAAECANYLGENNKVEEYINAVRERAYGANWDADVYGYKAGDFKANEVAILQEKDKEFVMEGQRWWDLRRLTTVKGGKQTDHLVFKAEGCVGYGLDTAANPWMVGFNGQLVDTNVPLFDGQNGKDEHLLLWPIDKNLLDSDETIKQNPGY